MATSVNLEEKPVKFDEAGVLAFAERMPHILKETVFFFLIMCTFCKGLDRVNKNFLDTPHDLTGDEYEV